MNNVIFFPGLHTTNEAYLLCREKLKHPQALEKGSQMWGRQHMRLGFTLVLLLLEMVLPALLCLASLELVSIWADR